MSLTLKPDTKVEKEESTDLTPLFNTTFLQRVLKIVAAQVPKQNLTLHVGSADSWPYLFFTGEYAAMIFNTDFRDEPGEHWIAVYINGSTQEAFIFDSLPVQPFPQIILDKLASMGNTICNINPDNVLLQDPAFPLCGIYCLYFLAQISKGLPFDLCRYNTLENDVNVLGYMWPYIATAFNLL